MKDWWNDSGREIVSGICLIGAFLIVALRMKGVI